MQKYRLALNSRLNIDQNKGIRIVMIIIFGELVFHNQLTLIHSHFCQKQKENFLQTYFDLIKPE